MMKNTDGNDNKTEHIGTSFYEYVEERVKHLRMKYPTRPKKALSSLFFWSFKQLFRSSTSLLTPEFKEKSWWRRSTKLNDNTPRIMFYLKGGIGDLIISSTYLKEFYKFLGGTHKFSVCTDQNTSISEKIFCQCPWVEQVYDRKNPPPLFVHDAAMTFCTVPRIVYRNPESTNGHWPKLEELLNIYETLKQKNNTICSLDPTFAPLASMYSQLNGHTRITQPDINHLLGMSNETRPCMVLDEKAFELLKKTGLENQTYITIQRGVDASVLGGKSTKLWPRTHYNELIRRIHHEFPSLSVVQVGKVDAESDLIGIDTDLRGQTSFDELMAVLKYSALHIDGECGMVHLTHTLGGRSAVFFGPTNIKFFGYPENINVKAKNACPSWCEWVTVSWYLQCLRGFDSPPCMEQLTPELFFDAIREHLQSVCSQPQKSLCKTEEATMPTGTLLFIGDFSDDEINAWVQPGNSVLHFSMNLTPEAIRNKNTRHIEADYADILNIPMKSESCDTVFCSQTQPLSEHALREMTRILKAGGVLKTGDGCTYVKN